MSRREGRGGKGEGGEARERRVMVTFRSFFSKEPCSNTISQWVAI